VPKVYRLSVAGRTGQTCTAPFPFILGVLPIVVATGAGGKMSQSLGRQCSQACWASPDSVLFSHRRGYPKDWRQSVLSNQGHSPFGPRDHDL